MSDDTRIILALVSLWVFFWASGVPWKHHWNRRKLYWREFRKSFSKGG